MSLLKELNTILSPLVELETGVFSKSAPSQYAVITPLSDRFGLFAEDKPQNETQEARISIYSKGNYTALKNQMSRLLLNADFIISDRRYIGHEDDTGYHHYVIDVAKNYELEE